MASPIPPPTCVARSYLQKMLPPLLDLLNFSWGVGAVACTASGRRSRSPFGVRGLAICVAVLAFALCVLHFRQPSSGPSTANSAKRSLADWLTYLQQRPAIPLLLLFFLYVGTEVSIGGWVAALEQRLPGVNTSSLAVAPSVFYGFLLIGRGMAPILLKRLSTFQSRSPDSCSLRPAPLWLRYPPSRHTFPRFCHRWLRLRSAISDFRNLARPNLSRGFHLAGRSFLRRWRLRWSGPSLASRHHRLPVAFPPRCVPPPPNR